MYKLILLLLLAVSVIRSQKYPDCPQNVPIDTGNTTDTFYLKLIALTSFLQQKDDGALFEAFHKYAKYGDQQEIQKILQMRKKFFIVIIVILSTVSLSLLLVVTRMGQLHLTTKNVFEKLKENGFSSPLSAFYAFVTIVLLASTCINAYQIQSMISRVNMTSCRLDSLNQAYLHGAVEYEWDGLSSFTQKMKYLSNFSNNLGSVITKNYQDKSYLLVYAQDYLQDLKLQYLGIVNNYNRAFIGDQYNASVRINLTTLLPNLFIDTAQNISLMTPLTNYLSLLQESLFSFVLLENALNQTADVFEGWGSIFSNLSSTLNLMSQDYSNDYVNLRLSIDKYMSESKNLLIACEVVSALTIFCTLAGLLSLKLIQSNYDYFSLSSYKIIWTFHVFMLTANLVFLMIVSQTLIYNKGMCLLADSMLQNRTLVQDIYPKITASSGMYYFYSCYETPNFGENVGTLNMTSVIAQLISIKQNVNGKYNVQNIGLYSDFLMTIKETIMPYQYGIIGNIAFIDAQLDAINNVTNINYQSQGCYKHHWVYSPQGCKSSEAGIIKPNKIAFLNNTKNYQKQASNCYLLSDYTSYTPSASNTTSFYQMYGKYNSKCPKSNAALASPINLFSKYFESRRCVFGRLNDEIKNLSQLMKNTTKYLIGYIFERNFILQNGLVVPGINNASELTTGQNCGVIKSIIVGLYNDFCINFAGSLRSIYLLGMCNIAYILFMIAFSLLYAIQLRNLLKKDLDQSYSDIHFVNTSQNMSSESASILSTGENQSGVSEKAQSQKAEKESKDRLENK